MQVGFWQGALKMAQERAGQLAARWPLPFRISEPPLLALPEPRKARAERIFGIELYGDSDWVVVRTPRTRELKRIGVSDTSPDLFSALQTGVSQMVFLSSAYRVDRHHFHAAMASAAKEMPENTIFRTLLRSICDQAEPRRGSSLIFRQGALWTSADMVTESHSSSALADAAPVSFEDYGVLLRQVLHRRVQMSLTTEHPLVDAMSQIEIETDFFLVDGRPQCIWMFVPRDAEALRAVLRLDVDVLASLENVSTQLYATLLLRAGAAQPNGFKELERSLAAFGQTRRLRAVEMDGSGLDDAWRAFVPGSSLLKGDHFRVEDPRGFLEVLASGIDTRAAETGDTYVGSSNGLPVFINRATRPSGAVIGTSGSGKTTLTSSLALQCPDGPNVLTVHFSSMPGEASASWTSALGGQFLNLRLPSSNSQADILAAITADDWAERYWEVLRSHWLKSGYPLDMPITLRRESGSPAHFVAVATKFLQGFIEAWTILHEQTGVKGVLVLDDIVSIGGLESEVLLGELPRQLGSAMRLLIQQLVDTGRKVGLTVIVTAHSVEEFRAWSDGFWESLTWAVVLKPETQFSQATLIEPPACPLSGLNGSGFSGVLVLDLNVRLPAAVVKILGRSFDLPTHP